MNPITTFLVLACIAGGLVAGYLVHPYLAAPFFVAGAATLSLALANQGSREPEVVRRPAAA